MIIAPITAQRQALLTEPLHPEFIRFLNRIEVAVPAGKLVHAILGNYAV
jgi:hypothetical protein